MVVEAIADFSASWLFDEYEIESIDYESETNHVLFYTMTWKDA